MIQTINESIFKHGIQDRRPMNFSWAGLSHLYDYFTELEDALGESIEFDPIGICCEYTEYESVKELAYDYPVAENVEDLEDLEAVRDYLEYHTAVVVCNEDCIIIQEF